MEAQIKKSLAEITGTSKVEDAIAGLDILHKLISK
tara:strand:+ start:99 stop:203 length:105 start_codon:yes stop_codon:yes gene_type:complete